MYLDWQPYISVAKDGHRVQANIFIEFHRFKNLSGHFIQTGHYLSLVTSCLARKYFKTLLILSLPDRPKPSTSVILPCLMPDDFTRQGRASG